MRHVELEADDTDTTPAPSFDAFGKALEAANPLAFWAQGAQLAWLSWSDASAP